MKKPLFILLLAFTSLIATMARAQTTTPDAADKAQVEATHNELRALRDGLMDAMNKGDIERELTYLAPNVEITWHNAEVSRGRDGVRAYYNRIMQGPTKVLDKFHADINVDELTILYNGDTGISFGSSVEQFTFTSGSSVELKGRWSATLVKQDGHWLIASLHVSDNIFDNPLLNMAKKAIYWSGAGGLLLGLVIGWLNGRRRKAKI